MTRRWEWTPTTYHSRTPCSTREEGEGPSPTPRLMRPTPFPPALRACPRHSDLTLTSDQEQRMTLPLSKECSSHLITNSKNSCSNSRRYEREVSGEVAETCLMLPEQVVVVGMEGEGSAMQREGEGSTRGDQEGTGIGLEVVCMTVQGTLVGQGGMPLPLMEVKVQGSVVEVRVQLEGLGEVPQEGTKVKCTTDEMMTSAEQGGRVCMTT